MADFIKELRHERERLILWVPVLFGAGILLYFSLPEEPSILTPWVVLLVVMLGVLASLREKVFLMPSIVLFMVIAGFGTVQIKVMLNKATALKEKQEFVWVRGTIESLEPREHGYRIILNKPDIWKFPLYRTPKKIRLNIRTKIGDAAPGDFVSLKATLLPLPKPVYPGGYDFARQAFFDHIGATGFSVTDVKIEASAKERGTDMWREVEAIRHAITERLLKATERSDMGQVAVALLTGERGGISKDTLVAMRGAGLGHLLAISGLHMALVMTLFFTVTRALLALIPPIALRFHIKKWSAIIALIAGAFYLLISGMPVSAQRAYIMVGIFFLALLLDRTGTPMRPVAWAAMILLCLRPEAVLTPSFQMSFAAVIALVAAYEKSAFSHPGDMMKKPWWKKLFYYIGGLLLTSVIAGLATTPFAIYHFGHYASYGLLANLVAIPLTTFLILPFGMLSIVLLPFGLEHLALAPMTWGITQVVSYAQMINGLPYAQGSVPLMNGFIIALIAFAGLWFCLWRIRMRWLAIIPLAIALSMIIRQESPDVILDGNGKLYAIRDEAGDLRFSSKVYARYAREQWLRATGQEDTKMLDKCDRAVCTYDIGDHTLVIYKQDNVIQRADIIFDNRNVLTVMPDELEAKGTHAIWFEEDKRIRVLTVEEARGDRPWVR